MTMFYFSKLHVVAWKENGMCTAVMAIDAHRGSILKNGQFIEMTVPERQNHWYKMKRMWDEVRTVE